MRKTDRIRLLLIGWPVAAAAQVGPPSESQALDYRRISEPLSPLAQACKADNPAEVLVCGRLERCYRIDPHVLAATRAANASPPKPPLNAAETDPCVGPDCGGATTPLVGMGIDRRQSSNARRKRRRLEGSVSDAP